MRVPRAYADTAMVAQVSRYLVAHGQTVLQIHRLAETEVDHVHELLRFFAPPLGAHVLDVGCGVGGVAKLMAAERPDLRFTLLNFSAEQLELCPAGFETICADAHEIALPDASVDATMICYALGHMDVQRVIQECARVTRPGGHLYLYDLTGESPQQLVEAFDYEAPSVEQITTAAAQAGFSLTRHQIPNETYAAHFFDKFPETLFRTLFKDIRPALFRFRRATPVKKSNRLARIVAPILAAATILK